MPAAAHESLLRLLRLCLALEDSPHAPTSQQLVLDSDALARLAGAGELPPSGIAIAAHYALGMLRIRFARVWPHVPPLLIALIESSAPGIAARPRIAAGSKMAAGSKLGAGTKMARPRASRIWALILDALTRAHGAGASISAAAETGEHDTEGEEPAGHSAEGGADIEGGAADAAGPGGDAPPDPSVDASADASPDADRPDLSLAAGRAWAESISGPAAETDLAHLASQLLRALGTTGSPLHRLAVADSAALMPLWRKLALAHLQSAALSAARADEPEVSPPGAAASVHAPTAPLAASAGPPPPKRLLSDWLRFFSAVEAPRSLAGAPALYVDCTALLAHPLPPVQSLALDCLARWNEPALVKHRKQLAGLIDGKTFRENLTLFSIDSHNSTLTPDERALLLPLLSRILFSRLTRRVGRGSSKSGMASTRATVFAFFGGFAPQELRTLLDLMLAPIRQAVASTPVLAGGEPAPDLAGGGRALLSQPTPASVYTGAGGTVPAQPTLPASALAGDGGGWRAACLRGVDGSTILGVLRSMHEAVAQLGIALLPYLPELLDTTNLVLRCAVVAVTSLAPSHRTHLLTPPIGFPM
jgi:hypothetical protein